MSNTLRYDLGLLFMLWTSRKTTFLRDYIVQYLENEKPHFLKIRFFEVPLVILSPGQLFRWHSLSAYGAVCD